MNGICITGASQTALRYVLRILQGAGMALPVDGGRELSQWHDHVLARRGRGDALTGLEGAARRIVAANSGSPLWGWADSRSLTTLELWRDLVPEMRFVLVCESPEAALARVLDADAEPTPFRAFMDLWTDCHTGLLRFYHRNSARAALVDAAECVRNPRAFLEHCASRWGLPLEVAPRSQVLSSGAETVAPCDESADALTRYVAKQLCAQEPGIRELRGEIEATAARLHGDATSHRSLRLSEDPDAIVLSYRDLRGRASRSAHFEALGQAAEERAAAAERGLADAQRDFAAHRDAAEARRAEAAQESELLLSQMLQMQEELDAALEDDAVRKEQLQAAASRTAEAKRREELLHLQLQQVQEELVHHFKQRQAMQKRLGVVEARLQRIFRRMPEYYDYDAVEILHAESGATQLMTWRVTNFNVSGRSFDALEFTTALTDGIATFGIPGLGRVTGRLDLRTTPGEELRRLASSDWQLLKTLPRLLKASLESPSPQWISAGVEVDALRSGLTRFEAALQELPATLRYDKVHLKREQVNPDYEHLWLRFEVAGFGSSHWPDFEFRLSCAHVRPGEFGRFPKLEFPQETGRAAFENWFIEAHDDFGPKLELRFALGEPSLDVDVWRRVSSRDRAFMLAILERLPAILADLRESGIQLQRSWDDWTRMAVEMHQLASKLSVQLSPTAPVGSRLTRRLNRVASHLGIVATSPQKATKTGGRS